MEHQRRCQAPVPSPHLHVQALNCGGDFEDGEYYDVVASNCSVRFDLNAATSSPYEGRTIMHCHILAHEDQGAMGWLSVLGGQTPPTFPADGDLPAPYSEHYSIGGGTGPFCGDFSQSACDNDGTGEAGEDCTNCSGDCDGITSGRPANRFSCGDRTLQAAEGDGTICDGNP